MNIHKHALVFFSKVPEAGTTKTRLTVERDGVMSPQEAAELYHTVLLDTADVGMHALVELNEAGRGGNAADRVDTYDFVVCSAPEKNIPQMKELFDAAGPWPLPIQYICDEGTNFNEHFDSAYKKLWQMGYETAVAIGGDLPQMPVKNLVLAFQILRRFEKDYNGLGLVHCPCQACGVSLVGLTKATPMDFEGIFYNTNGVSALDGIINTAKLKGFPVAALETVADIDTVEDLAHALSMARSQEYTSQFQPEVLFPKRFLAWAEREGYVVCTPPNENHDPRTLIDV
ncbi:MAG: DUF2064 domain-containing protein [Acidobacteriota bacterium]|nr:DUF2064 domain-containing protein [Acidobacteriota bacterium]